MKYGARYIRWAPVKSTSENALPTYGDSISLGGLQKVSDNPSYSEAKGFEDDALAIHVSEFKECTVDVEIGELENATAAAVLGAKLETEGEDLRFGSDDNASDGGLAFVICKILKGNLKRYQGIFYPTLKAAMQGEEYSGKGESIALTNSKLHFLARPAENGTWKVKSKDFDKVEDAIAWVDKNLPKQAAAGE